MSDDPLRLSELSEDDVIENLITIAFRLFDMTISEQGVVCPYCRTGGHTNDCMLLRTVWKIGTELTRWLNTELKKETSKASSTNSLVSPEEWRRTFLGLN